jgi:serine/threonine protein kinase
MKQVRHLHQSSYRVLHTLQEGATADAWVVENEVTGQTCVRKTYSTLGLEDSAARAEPTILSEISHPHVVQVLDAHFDTTTPNAITFITPYYPGGSVLTALEEGQRFSVHHALKLSGQLLRALSFVHQDVGLVHRDVKPSNAFLDATRQHARLGDFGSAARPGPDGAASPVQGTPLYKPPEAGSSHGRHGIRGDIYATGLTLFELLNGPFDYASMDFGVVDRRLSRGLTAVPLSSPEFAPHVPQAVRRVVRKAIRSNPAQRFATADEFLRAINRVGVIDWRHSEGLGLTGRWDGTWPPSDRVERRRRYRIEVAPLKSGSQAGRLRAVALQATSPTSAFARFGVSDRTMDPEDRGGVAEFFDAVEVRAAHLRPAAR